MILLVRKT